MKKDFNEISSLLAEIIEKKELLFVAMSSPLSPQKIQKGQIRPISIQNQLSYQVTVSIGEQVFHENHSPALCLEWIKKHLLQFKQTLLHTSTANYHLLVNKKGSITLLKQPPSKTSYKETKHNRKKNSFFTDGDKTPLFCHLGIMNEKGKVYPDKQDKFRQINRFLEMVDDILPSLSPGTSFRVVDFGCGKAYLSFVLFYFLQFLKGLSVEMWGIDRKKKVIEECQELTRKLGYEKNLHFFCGEIDDFHIEGDIDLAVSLHACDIATDVALEKSIRHKAQMILAAPCCQHELLHQITQDALQPLLKHGILKERFAALSTDAARAQLLEVCGYQTQIIEFIDPEHTPKNLLIRAIKKQKSKDQKKKAWEVYQQFKTHLHISPSLEKYLCAHMGREQILFKNE